MKIIQTDSQLEIQKGAVTSVVSGTILLIVGLTLTTACTIATLGAEKKTNWIIIAVVGFLLALGGAAFIFFASKTRIVFQRGGDTQIDTTRLFGGKTTHESFPTASITSLQLETYVEITERSVSSQDSRDSGGFSSNRTELDYSRHGDLYLVLNDGRRIEIDRASNSLTNNGLRSGLSVGIGTNNVDTHVPLSDEANQIGQFLSIQVSVFDPKVTSVAVGAENTLNGNVAQPVQVHSSVHTPQPTVASPQPVVAQQTAQQPPVATLSDQLQTPPPSVDQP